MSLRSASEVSFCRLSDHARDRSVCDTKYGEALPAGFIIYSVLQTIKLEKCLRNKEFKNHLPKNVLAKLDGVMRGTEIGDSFRYHLEDRFLRD